MITAPEQKVLDALAIYSDRSGVQLAQMTNLDLALYPALMTLEQRGLITSRWLNEDGLYPRRRVYRLKAHM